MNKQSDFRDPLFNGGTLKLRWENDVVCIYGTEDGLRDLMPLCQRLLDRGKEDHIHIEDKCRLTSESEIGAVALFR